MKKSKSTNTSEMKVGQYLRCSTAEQRQHLQDDETRAFIERRGWQLVETYADHGVSGSRDRRPGLDRMLADARRGKLDAIVVWRSDRLFRSLKHMVNTIADLASWNVAFVSCTEPFDTSTPSGELMLHLVSAFAQFERQVIVARVRAGLDAARRRGVQLGRPSNVQLDVGEAAKLRAAGMSYRAISRQLGVTLSRLHTALTAGVQ
jgi:DNA invertase Pin-like site-specific DNA recombinase